MNAELIDRIYECSFAPELWPGVLDELATIADASGGHIFVQDAAITKVECWTCSESMRLGMELFVASDIVARGHRARRLLALRHPGFVTEHDIYADPETECRSDPYYGEMLYRANLGWGTGTSVPLPHGGTAILTLERRFDRGPVEVEIVDELNGLRPHLARSALISARLQMERARAAAEALALIGLPALVFDERGKALAANQLIEASTDHIRWRAQDRVGLKDANADAQLRQAIEALDFEGDGPTRSFALRGESGAASMVAHVIPLRRAARDLFSQCAGVLILTPVAQPQAPGIELVQSLFDLTPAEARVARGLVTGATVEEIAGSANVALSTVRTQLRGVLQKTGCRRQAEVIALLGGLSPMTG